MTFQNDTAFEFCLVQYWFESFCLSSLAILISTSEQNEWHTNTRELKKGFANAKDVVRLTMAGCCQEARGKEDNLNRYKGSESSRDRKKTI